MRAKGLIILVVALVVFLAIRKWIDRIRERVEDTEIVRDDMDEGDAHLGFWAQKNANALIQIRLKRDGTFKYEVIEYPINDTIRHIGQYQIYNEEQPRLMALSNTGDTIINHYVYLMRATKRNVDILGLKESTQVDAGAMLFYRIKQ
ncbi:MAG TPA: hypothetical protein PLM56_06120 [Cyclobacteriaceae bacterium]|jgi:hypothetical protein|nr:hypothetical protein [Cytophagales bacterium]HNT49426.1 hypothetical protein [Cyclobacteriaceae bacterium]HRE67339.1 hypothetical protein [Cyclobacteriaceae bacterium]HRF33053.1 hypothetical protein [Cyclobacteriaceae bacterium]